MRLARPRSPGEVAGAAWLICRVKNYIIHLYSTAVRSVNKMLIVFF